MTWLPPTRSIRRRNVVAILAFLVVVLYLGLVPIPSLDYWEPAPDIRTNLLPCAELPGAEDVFLIVRTGATEIHRKLPVHLSTTLRCVPDFEIFSDLEETIQGFQVHDALDELSPIALQEYPEFDFYRKLHQYKDEGKNITALLDKAVKEEDNSRKAWSLDKWKFLPLIDKAYRMRPDAKWYILMEADTYLMWSNILIWLEKLSPEEPLYIGGQTWGGDVEFGHGGSGIIISHSAIEMLVEKQARNIEIFEKISADDWAGDRALSVAFDKVGIKLTEAFPMIQGETPFTLDFTENHWCHAIATYHHMPPGWIQKVWDFEQEWISSARTANSTIYHRHVFDHFVLPEIQSEKEDWDNLSNDEQKDFYPATVEHCRKLCERNKNCVQYSFTPDTCKTNNVVRLGKPIEPPDEDEEDEKPELELTKFLPGPKPTSGWIIERVLEFKGRLGACKKPWAATF